MYTADGISRLPSVVNLLVAPYYAVVECAANRITVVLLPPVAGQVDVSRSVIDQYGTMEWEVTFTMNPGTTPPGAGDMESLSIVQNLTGIEAYATHPIVTETQQGSVGLSGTFSLNYNDPGGAR